MEAAGVGFTPLKSELTALHCGDKKQLVEVGDHFCTLRTDTQAVLGVVGERYTVLQNFDAFTFFDALVGSR